MTKRINSLVALGAFSLLGGCADSEDVVINAPPTAEADEGEAKAPTTTKDGDLDLYTPAKGDPALANPYPATTFVPLLDWSFEMAGADCNGWPVAGADSSIRAIPAKSGSYSCKVCSNGSSHDLTLSRQLGKVAKGGYTLSAYVRKRAQTAAPTDAVARITRVTGATVITSEPVSVREEWDHIHTSIELTEDTDDLTISIGSAHAELDNCLFVDDVTFTRNY